MLLHCDEKRLLREQNIYSHVEIVFEISHLPFSKGLPLAILTMYYVINYSYYKIIYVMLYIIYNIFEITYLCTEI